MRYRRVGVLLFATVLLLTLGVGSASAQWHHDETTGAAIPMPEPLQQNLSDELDQYRDYHSADDTNVWLLHTERQPYIVVSRSKPVVSTATVRGQTHDGDEFGVILADSTEFDTTPRSVDPDTLANHPDELTGEYVTAEIKTTQTVYAYDGAGGRVRHPQTSGIFQGMTIDPIAESAQYQAWNLSESEPSLTSEASLLQITGKTPHVSHRTDFAIDNAPTRIEGVVLPRAPGQTSGQPVVYLTSAQPIGEPVDSERVLNNPEDYSGDVVKFDADLVGARASVKRLLVRSSACDGSETIGFAPKCIPAVTDVQLHTGVALSPSQPDTMLAYGGLSNHLQSRAVEPVAGHYTVTARVVSGEEVHPSIGGYALEVYGLEREGAVEVRGSERDEADAAAERVFERVREQLITPPAKQAEYKASASDQESPTQGPGAELEVVSANYRDNPIPPGGVVIVDVKVRNVGSEGKATVTLEHGDVVDSRTVTLEEGGTKEITLQYDSRRKSPGSLRHYVNGTDVGMLQFAEEETDTATVTESATEEDGAIPAIPITILGLMLSIQLIDWRRD